jgi:hypothetical protein
MEGNIVKQPQECDIWCGRDNIILWDGNNTIQKVSLDWLYVVTCFQEGVNSYCKAGKLRLTHIQASY